MTEDWRTYHMLFVGSKFLGCFASFALISRVQLQLLLGIFQMGDVLTIFQSALDKLLG